MSFVSSGCRSSLPYFFDQMSWLLSFSLFILVWLLFEGGIYFIGTPPDSNDGWIRYMWALQLGLIDTGSSMHSLLVLLSAVETSLRTHTVLEIAQWESVGIISTQVCVPHVLLFEGGVYFGQSFWLCEYYSRAASKYVYICLTKPLWYIHDNTMKTYPWLV